MSRIDPLAMALALGLMVVAPGLADCSVPAPRGDVSDFADLLTSADELEIAEHVAALKDPGAHLVLVTIPTSGGCTPKGWAHEAFNQWGVGERGQDNGVLVLLALAERRVEVETGEGVQRRLSDETVGEIIDAAAVPQLRKNRWGRGLVALTAGITHHLSGQPWEGTTPDAAQPDLTPLRPPPVRRGGKRIPPRPRPLPAPWYVALLRFVLDPLNSAVVLSWVWMIWSLSLPVRGIFVNRRFGVVGLLLAFYAWGSVRLVGRGEDSVFSWIFLGLGLMFALYTLTRRCPDCGAGYTRIHDRVLRYATTYSRGLTERTVDCPRCAYHRVSTTSIPRQVRTSSIPVSSWSSTTSTSSSSSFSSFGGGSSGGGGAGRSF